MTTRHFIVWGPYFDTVDDALDHFHGKGQPVKVVLDVSVSGHFTGSVELEMAPKEAEDVEVS